MLTINEDDEEDLELSGKAPFPNSQSERLDNKTRSSLQRNQKYTIFHIQQRLQINSELSSRYRVLIDDFKSNNKFCSFFLVIDLMRNVILSFVLVLISDSPLSQIILFVVINSLVILYMLIVRPFNDLKLFFLNLLNEVTLITICGLILHLMTLDESIDDFNRVRYDIGWKIYYVNFFMKFVMGLNWIVETLVYFKRSIDSIMQVLNEEAQAEKKKNQDNKK